MLWLQKEQGERLRVLNQVVYNAILVGHVRRLVKAAPDDAIVSKVAQLRGHSSAADSDSLRV